MDDKKRRNKAVKVPVVLQMEALECGAASLTMILAYYDKWVPLDVVRNDCGVSRDGSNALSIIKAARKYGLDVKANRFGPGLLKEYGSFPCIIWWNYNHFVVMNGYKGDSVVINDPARGRIVVSEEEFESSYSGLCMRFEKSESFTADGKPKSIFSFFRKRIENNEYSLILVMLSSFLAVIAGIFVPVFSRVFSDRILTGENADWLQGFLWLFLFVILLQFMCRFVNIVFISKLTGRMAVRSNIGFMWHLLRMPISFFSQRMSGDLTSRQSENDIVSKTLVQQLAPAVIQLFLLVFYIVIMINYSVILSLIAIITVGVILVITRFVSKKQMEITRIQMRDDGKVNSTTVSGIDMIETIKASGAENGYFERWAGYHASSNKAKVEYAGVSRFLGSLPSFFQEISSVAIICAGSLLIINGKLSYGLFLAFQTYMISFLTPANLLISAGNSIQQMRSYMERIDDVMEYPADSNFSLNSDKNSSAEIKKLIGDIELNNITFGYSKAAEPVLKDFSINIRQGSRIALVGGSGSGKSTVAKLLSGLYRPWSGTIRIDGQLLDEIPREILTASISVVDQDVVMFADTIENNIKMWDTTIENFDVILAAKDAQIHEAIVKRKYGYSEHLGDSGKGVSGGEKQRLEIARVLATDPSIIILDEATSALDAKTEYTVSQAIMNRGVTCIIIAHRLSTIRDCDEIIVLEHGSIAERGTHEELLALNGIYSKLVTTE